MTTIVTLLFLAAMLWRNNYCREDNNFILIALASAIVTMSIFLPSSLSAAICFGTIVTVALIVVENYDVEDLLITQFAVKLFSKKRPAELDEKFGTYGGGFGELIIRNKIRNQIYKRESEILNVIRIAISLLAIVNIVILLTRIISAFGWASILVIPLSLFLTSVVILLAYYYLYER